MARVETIIKPAINLELSPEEASGLLELLGYGCTGNVVATLGLNDVYQGLYREAQYPTNIVWERIAHIREK
jgi:hypothetical protein